MPVSTLAMIGRAILLLISFSGLCAGIRSLFKVHHLIAPYVAVCGIIIVLMLAGMLHVLEIAFWLLYFAGFAGLICAKLTPPRKVYVYLIIYAAVFAALLTWRFYPCLLYQNDDISHWGLVARHLLRYDSFPDRNASFVFFQSYPLGAASFIYYICKAVTNTEGMYLIAQNLLFGLFYVPVFAHINSSKRRICYPIALAIFIFFFSYSRSYSPSMIDLRVDALLAFFGFGTSSSIIYYRNDLKKALICAIPGMIAVTYLKNSGIFFAMVEAALLIWIACRNKVSRKTILITGISSIGSIFIAQMLWNLHIRVSYPDALNTKHAISLSAYAAEASSKSFDTLFTITKRFAYKLLDFSPAQCIGIVFFLVCALLLIYGCFSSKAKRKEKKRCIAALIACIGVYAVWCMMLYLMYIFSMPELEAVSIAGFSRYNCTGMLYSMGLTAIALLIFYGSQYTPIYRSVRLLQWGSSALIVCSLLVIAQSGSIPGFQLDRSEAYPTERAVLMRARQDHSLPDQSRYAFFCFDDNLSVGPYHEYYRIKYEFETADILMFAENPEEPGLFLAGTREENEITPSLCSRLTEALNTCEAILILNQSDAFESQLRDVLKKQPSDTPIIYAYKYVTPKS